MFRAHIGIATLAAIASLTATTPAAHAADYSPPPIVQPEEYSGWYLRGFVGVGMSTGSTIEYQPDPVNVGNGFVFDQHSMGDTAFVGGGFGYEVNHWLRFDGTAEYRTRTQFNARGVYDPITGQGDSYQGYMKSLVFLANAYADLGTWNCFTPFLGAGIGVAYNQVVDFVDMGIGTTGAGFGRDTAEWHLAWAVYAGVAYNVTKNFKVDFTYRYLNLGSATDTIDCIGGCVADSYKFGKLQSHDFMLGMRWTCCEAPAPERVAIRSKG
jgi:opacity protein-like surface antigen